ncbi:homocysteine s-methyltransferase domain-containing protein [Sarocladium implicatum]|nr:homocysteine s-methyltransferase domain-containing protein [Sarocladium implicatum]
MASPLILDGGMSRELMRLNAPFRQPEWSALALIEAPHLVRQVHEDFITAGADIITTNSYALVPFHIGEERFWKQAAELAALSGRLAREAADSAAATEGGRKVLVAGGLPPIFGSYEPEKFDGSRVQEYLAVLVTALAPYVDVWLAETLSLISEAIAARDATKSTGKPFWAAFCPDDGGNASAGAVCLRSDETIEQVTEWSIANHIDALLFNCARPAYVDEAVKIAKQTIERSTEETHVVLGVYANAFAPKTNEDAANESISPVDQALNPHAFGQLARTWFSDGASIIGGCCGVGHEHIRELKAVLPR